MIDDRINLKLNKEMGTKILNRVKALTILHHGQLYGNFSNKVLELLDIMCDIIERDPIAALGTHTHQVQNVSKRHQLIELTRFITQFEDFFLSKARSFDVLEQKIKSFFNITDQRPVRAKVKDICYKLRLGILRLPCGLKLVLPLDGEAYELLERFDVKYSGRKTRPNGKEKEYIAAAKRDAGVSLPEVTKEADKFFSDYGGIKE